LALKASNQGSDFTLMNPGGVRADLLINSSNQITFGDVEYDLSPLLQFQPHDLKW
jgi:2',3'-cyclic-nucleotide 2'-phosphodiesterase (5'-nucleotidase family)